MADQPSYRVERVNELIRRELVTLLKKRNQRSEAPISECDRCLVQS